MSGRATVQNRGLLYARTFVSAPTNLHPHLKTILNLAQEKKSVLKQCFEILSDLNSL